MDSKCCWAVSAFCCIGWCVDSADQYKSSDTNLFSCPMKMRLGAVPVRVAVPPMLAA